LKLDKSYFDAMVPTKNCGPLIWMVISTYYFLGGNIRNIYLYLFYVWEIRKI